MKSIYIVPIILLFLFSCTSQLPNRESTFLGSQQHYGAYKTEGIKTKPSILWEFKASGGINTSPVYHEGLVVIGTNAGAIHAVDSKTGKEQWVYNGEREIYSTPTVSEGNIYFGTNSGDFLCLNAETGTMNWMFNTKGKIESSPTVINNIVYFTSRDTYLYALDASSGDLLWRSQIGKSKGSRTIPWNFYHSSPTVFKKSVYVGGYNGIIYAFNAVTGDELWRFATLRANARGLSNQIIATPIINGDQIIIPAIDGFIYLLNADDGQEIKRFNSGYAIYHSIALWRNRLFLPTRNSSNPFICMNIKSGEPFWTYKSEVGFQGSWYLAVLLVSDVAYVTGSDSHMIYATDLRTGKELWTYKLSDRIWAAPTQVENILYVASADGVLYALQ